MKKQVYYLFVFICLSVWSCSNSSDNLSTSDINIPQSAENPNNTDDLPVINMEHNVIDFGTISQGETVEKVFWFTNTGNSNLIISSATGSCGCTIPSWPKAPIKPGEKKSIKVIFNSNGKSGRQHKTITIATNARPSLKIIALKGTVLVPEYEKK